MGIGMEPRGKTPGSALVAGVSRNRERTSPPRESAPLSCRCASLPRYPGDESPKSTDARAVGEGPWARRGHLLRLLVREQHLGPKRAAVSRSDSLRRVAGAPLRRVRLELGRSGESAIPRVQGAPP